jgi:hypothetical protein
MRINTLRSILKTAVYGASVLLFGAGAASAQQQINLAAGPSTITLPDGSAVPMWGYSCGAVATSSTATCAKLNPTATGWSPVVITVPTTAAGGLQINLTNNLSFSTGLGTNAVPTSLVIVGQLGGGLGTPGGHDQSPSHANARVTTTWPIAGGVGPGIAEQGPRVRSFSTEVAAGATTALPPWSTLRPGTYLIESGTHPSIQGPMGLYGILVVTTAPASGAAGIAYPAAGTAPAVTYNADIPMLFSEIDPVQNNAVATAVSTAGFLETNVWSGQPGACGNPASPVGVLNTCYPPAVNYTPLYYMINGVAFSNANASASLFPVSPATGVTGSVLVRMVNAGLRMHIPSIVGSQTQQAATTNNNSPATFATTPATVSGFSLIAEDGNPLPGLPHVQSEVFMAAGKTYDVMINVPAAGATALPIFDRELSLSANATAQEGECWRISA